MVLCNICGEDFARHDSLSRHMKRKYPCGVTPTTKNIPKKLSDDDVAPASADIPTFEEAEFSGVKPLTEETLLRMMEMMKMAYENRARIIKLEKRFYQRTVISE